MKEQNPRDKLLSHLRDTYQSLWPQLKKSGDQTGIDVLEKTLIGRVKPLLPDAPDEPYLKGRKYIQLPSGGRFLVTKQSYLDFFKENFQAEEIIELSAPKRPSQSKKLRS